MSSSTSFSRDAADLSSVRTGIDDIAQRIVSLADEYASGPDEDLATRLYEVERNLLGAARRLGVILKDMESR